MFFGIFVLITVAVCQVTDVLGQFVKLHVTFPPATDLREVEDGSWS